MAPVERYLGRIVTGPREPPLRLRSPPWIASCFRRSLVVPPAMKTLKVGAILLSIWSGLNLCVAAGVTVGTFLERKPPALALLLNDSEIGELDPRAIAVVNAQATLANPCIVALCALTLVVVWTSLIRGARWAWLALFGTLLPLQAFGFVSDAFLGHRNLGANVASSGLLLLALVFSGLGLRSLRKRARISR